MIDLTKLIQYIITMSTNPFLSKEVKLKRVRKGFVIAFPVVVMIFVISNYYINLIDDTLKNDNIRIKEEITIEVEEEDKKQEIVLGTVEEKPITVVGIDKIKKRLSVLIPDKYRVVKLKRNFYPGIQDTECVSLYEIEPKDYFELERKYLDSAYIYYCKDINTASLNSQIGEVRYDSKEDSWFYKAYPSEESKSFQEKKTFGTNIVTISETSGSHHSWVTYIVRVDDSNEVIMILIPRSTRIRCEEYDENGNETWKKDCVEFITSMGMSADSSQLVPDEIYEDYYKDLVEILKDI